METTEEVFQAVGNTQEEMELLMSLVIPGVILAAVAFNMAEMPSGPFDFEVSSDLQRYIFRTEVLFRTLIWTKLT